MIPSSRLLHTSTTCPWGPIEIWVKYQRMVKFIRISSMSIICSFWVRGKPVTAHAKISMNIEYHSVFTNVISCIRLSIKLLLLLLLKVKIIEQDCSMLQSFTEWHYSIHFLLHYLHHVGQIVDISKSINRTTVQQIGVN